MQESRVSRLLKDARATVTTPVRPNTPREVLPRVRANRLSDALSGSMSGSFAAAGPSLTTSTEIASLATAHQKLSMVMESPSNSTNHNMEVVLSSLATADAAMTDYMTSRRKSPPPAGRRTVVEGEVTPSDLLRQCNALRRWVEQRAEDSAGQELPVMVRACAIVVRHGATLSIVSGELDDPSVLAEALSGIHQAAKQGGAPLVRKEMVFDLLIQTIRNPLSAGWTRDMVKDCVGCLRAVSSEGGELLSHLITLGILPATNALTQRVLPTADMEILTHAATIYRNVSVEVAHHLAKLGSLPLLIVLLETSTKHNHRELATAVSRTLAKVVFEESCLQWLRDNLSTATNACFIAWTAFRTSRAIVARLGLCLHTLLDEANDTLVEQLLRLLTPEQWVDVLENAVLQAQLGGVEEDEALLNVLRVVSSLTLNPSAGTLFASHDRVFLALAGLVRQCDAKQYPADRQLMLNALMSLSNISFYLDEGEGSSSERDFDALMASICPIIVDVLFEGDVEGIVEATRLFGNLSRTTSGKDWIEVNRCDEACLVFLGHVDHRIVYNCFGVILNLTASEECRLVTEPELCEQLLSHTAKYHTLNVSDDESDEAQLSSLVEKILLNMSNLM